MKILISNDDGISSPGIYALAQSLKMIGDVTVIAPLTEQSAVGHAITMKNPLRIKEHFIGDKFFGYAIDGTPADCIKIGINNILDFIPDIVVSGINNGSNAAINIVYSGTVSAAREAAIMDIPSFAVSVTSHEVDDYEPAAKYAKKIAELVYKNGLPKGTMLNINVPNIPQDKILGPRITSQGKSKWDEKFEERVDPFGKKYYWLAGNLLELDNSIDTDHFATEKGYISITPIHFDLTDYEALKTLNNWDL